jgi:hypothetical protein|tara:strand:+ start:2303 stop:2692 length:390 start_codon:yes stop_codon:yes gene_type:complete
MLNDLIESAIRSKGAHYDLAAIIYFFYKDEYKVVNDKWFKLSGVDPIKWQEMEAPTDLYINISRKIFDVLIEAYDKLYEQSKTAETLDMSDLYKEKARKLQRIANNCKMVNYKNSLIRECKPLFTVDEL